MLVIVIRRLSARALLAVTMLSLSLSLSFAACGGACPPIQRDDLFPLDLSTDGGASSRTAPDGAVAAATDAAATYDAASRDGAPPPPPPAGTAPDGGATSTPYRANCGVLAEGCTPGQSCPPACDCVLARQRMGMNPMAVVDRCILAAGATPPSVEVRSHIRIDCE